MIFVMLTLTLLITVEDIVPLFQEKLIKDAICTSLVLTVALILGFIIIFSIPFKSPFVIILDIIKSLGMSF